MKVNYEPYLSCSMGAAAAEPIGVWRRSGIGTRWLVVVEDADRGRHGHPGGESSPRCAPDYSNNQVMARRRFSACVFAFILE